MRCSALKRPEAEDQGVGMGSRIQEVAETALQAVAEAFTNDLRPVCDVYQTNGTPVIFTCCDCDGGSNGELSIHLERVFDADAATLLETQRVRPCKGGVVAAQFQLVLARCYPTIDETGDVPDKDFQTEAAEDQARDVELMWQALACSGLMLRVDDISIDLGPRAGCAVVSADITVRVDIPPIPADSSL